MQRFFIASILVIGVLVGGVVSKPHHEQEEVRFHKYAFIMHFSCIKYTTFVFRLMNKSQAKFPLLDTM